LIKVNLLRDKTNTTDVAHLANVGKKTYKEILGVKKDGFVEPEVSPAIKILIMVVPLGLFYLYEMKIQKDAQQKVSRITAEIQQTEGIRDEKKQLVSAITNLKREYDVRLPILNEFKKISKEKVHGVKMLDQLQDLLPPELWVTEVDLDRTQIDIAGISTSDKQLTIFQKNLEDSIYFENILIYNSIENKVESGDSNISFKMKANFSKEVLGGG
jgi:hypothetical protein